jgi:molybdopterin synthase sulfur carrier subunit
MTSTVEEGTVAVHLPPQLRAQAGTPGRLDVRAEGGTVGAVIEALECARPGMRFHLCLETGELRPFVNVFVNGVNVRYLRGLETPAPPGATIHIFQSVAGG